MSKPVVAGLIVGGVFCAAIVWGAASSAFAEGGLLLLAVTLNGLIGGLIIGGLIAANFALLSLEEREEEKLPQPKSGARAAA